MFEAGDTECGCEDGMIRDGDECIEKPEPTPAAPVPVVQTFPPAPPSFEPITPVFNEEGTRLTVDVFLDCSPRLASRQP